MQNYDAQEINLVRNSLFSALDKRADFEIQNSLHYNIGRMGNTSPEVSTEIAMVYISAVNTTRYNIRLG